MELTEIIGMALGEKKALRANGRYKVGQILNDENPHISAVLRVVDASPLIVWDRGRVDDEDDCQRQPGDITTDIVVERIERSVKGQSVVDAYWGRYRSPIKVIARELRVNACGGNNFFRGSGEVRPLSKNNQQHPALPVVREEPVSGFGGDQSDRVYALPADGWYEATAMRSPCASEGYFFRLDDGQIVDLIVTGSLHRRYDAHWTQLFEAKARFRNEHGV